MKDDAKSNGVVVLGLGAAATSAIVALRRSGYDGAIAVVSDAGEAPYSPVLTSYYVGGRIAREQCFSWSDIDIAGMVDHLCCGVRAEAIDADAHEVALSDGNRLGYSKLLVATGAHPATAEIPGLQPHAAHTLRTLEDADRLRRCLEARTCRSVLVSGTSMVGLKVVEACLDRELDVTLLGRSAHVLRSTAHPAVAVRLESLLVERGVTLRLSQRIVRAHAETAGGYRIEFDNGDTARFDEVVIAQGVTPTLDFIARGSGFPPSVTESADRGLAVDASMRTAVPNVFAAGDVARTLDLSTGDRRIMGLWQNAVQQGRCAGEAIAAELAGHAPRRQYPGAIPSNVIHVHDILFASAGSVAEAPGRRIALEDASDGTLAVFAYEEGEGNDHLIGFNVLAVEGAIGHAQLMDDIGRFRSSILKACAG